MSFYNPDVMSSNKNIRKISKDEIVEFYPSIINNKPKENLSSRYSPISTMDIIETFEKDNWYVGDICEVKARNKENKPFSKHLIRFCHNDLMHNERALNAILINSHDGTTKYKFLGGLIEFICSNGCICGDKFEEIELKHMGITHEQVLQVSYDLLNRLPLIANSINDMSMIELSTKEKNIMSESALMIMYPQIENKDLYPISTNDLLYDRHQYQRKSNLNSLWTTFNILQENVIKGGIHGIKTDENGRKRRMKTRKVKAIDRNTSLNRALWNIAEKTLEINGIIEKKEKDLNNCLSPLYFIDL